MSDRRPPQHHTPLPSPLALGRSRGRGETWQGHRSPRACPPDRQGQTGGQRYPHCHTGTVNTRPSGGKPLETVEKREMVLTPKLSREEQGYKYNKQYLVDMLECYRKRTLCVHPITPQDLASYALQGYLKMCYDYEWIMNVNETTDAETLNGTLMLEFCTTEDFEGAMKTLPCFKDGLTLTRKALNKPAFTTKKISSGIGATETKDSSTNMRSQHSRSRSRERKSPSPSKDNSTASDRHSANNETKPVAGEYFCKCQEKFNLWSDFTVHAKKCPHMFHCPWCTDFTFNYNAMLQHAEAQHHEPPKELNRLLKMPQSKKNEPRKQRQQQQQPPDGSWRERNNQTVASDMANTAKSLSVLLKLGQILSKNRQASEQQQQQEYSNLDDVPVHQLEMARTLLSHSLEGATGGSGGDGGEMDAGREAHGQFEMAKKLLQKSLEGSTHHSETPPEFTDPTDEPSIEQLEIARQLIRRSLESDQDIGDNTQDYRSRDNEEQLDYESQDYRGQSQSPGGVHRDRSQSPGGSHLYRDCRQSPGGLDTYRNITQSLGGVQNMDINPSQSPGCDIQDCNRVNQSAGSTNQYTCSPGGSSHFNRLYQTSIEASCNQDSDLFSRKPQGDFDEREQNILIDTSFSPQPVSDSGSFQGQDAFLDQDQPSDPFMQTEPSEAHFNQHSHNVLPAITRDHNAFEGRHQEPFLERKSIGDPFEKGSQVGGPSMERVGDPFMETEQGEPFPETPFETEGRIEDRTRITSSLMQQNFEADRQGMGIEEDQQTWHQDIGSSDVDFRVHSHHTEVQERIPEESYGDDEVEAKPGSTWGKILFRTPLLGTSTRQPPLDFTGIQGPGSPKQLSLDTPDVPVTRRDITRGRTRGHVTRGRQEGRTTRGTPRDHMIQHGAPSGCVNSSGLGHMPRSGPSSHVTRGTVEGHMTWGGYYRGRDIGWRPETEAGVFVEQEQSWEEEAEYKPYVEEEEWAPPPRSPHSHPQPECPSPLLSSGGFPRPRSRTHRKHLPKKSGFRGREHFTY